MKTSELPPQTMRAVKIEEKDILLAHTAKSVFAIGSKCPHYGADLAEGVLCGDRVICPWHKTCFRVTDGRLLDPPALENVPSYTVKIEGDDILVSSTEQKLAPVPIAQGSESKTFVIAGAGAAGMAAAQMLREQGFAGRLAVVTAESEPPYDRTKLSKEFLSGNAGSDKLPLHGEEFYSKQRIELVRAELSTIDATGKRLSFSDGKDLEFDALLIATGSRPRYLQVPGADLGNIFLLRSQADAEAILRESAPGTRAVVVGGSFIALEAASCFAIRKMPTTVILPDSAPFEKKFGKEVGEAFLRWHRQHGVEFRPSAKVKSFEGAGVVRQVVLDSGQRVPADVVVIGVGVQPATDMVTGLKKNSDGGIMVDRYLQARSGVYAAGDVAVFPLSSSGKPQRIEHWRVAEQQGRAAALNMLGKNSPYEGVPYFWTNHFGTRFDYLGHAERWDEIILHGDIDEPKFIAFYIADGRLVAAAACRRDREIAALHELMRLGKTPTPDQLRNSVDLVSLARV